MKGREGENGQLCWYGIPYGAAPTGESLSLIHIYGDVAAALTQGCGGQGLHRGAVDDDTALGLSLIHILR